MKVFFSDLQPLNLPTGHIYPADKYFRLRQQLVQQNILSLEQLIPAQPAVARQILRVHTQPYYDAVCSGTLNAQQLRVLGLPWTERLVMRAHLGVGAVIAAAQSALQDGIAGSLSGGTHHAFADEGRGFCVFNDIAVAVHDLFAENRVSRAAVIDLDAHQGNGTAAIFADDPRVFTLDLYGSKNYPVRRVPARLDVPLPEDAGDEIYLHRLADTLPAVLRFEPQIIFYIGGVDPLEGDRFNKMRLSMTGLQRRDEMVLETCRRNGIPIVLTMGGGYSPVDITVQAHLNTYRAVQSIFHSPMIRSSDSVHASAVSASLEGKQICK